MYAQGTRDGLDLLADGEISLATAAELASLESKLTRRQQESTVEDVLDKQLRKLQENDQKKDDLRRAEQLVEILAMIKRHPELEAHISRQLNPGTHICKIWNIALPKAAGYVHTPLSQMFHLRPITVRKDGVNLTPEEQMALPENEGRRYIAAEWEAQEPEELFMHAQAQPLGRPRRNATASASTSSSATRTAAHQACRRNVQPHSSTASTHADSPASIARLHNDKGHIGYPGRCDLISRAPKPVTAGYTNNTGSTNNTASPTTRPAQRRLRSSRTTASKSTSPPAQHGRQQPTAPIDIVTAPVCSHGSGESGRKGKAPPFGRRRSLRSRPCARPPPVRWGGCQGKEKRIKRERQDRLHQGQAPSSFSPLISLFISFF